MFTSNKLFYIHGVCIVSILIQALHLSLLVLTFPAWEPAKAVAGSHLRGTAGGVRGDPVWLKASLMLNL